MRMDARTDGERADADLVVAFIEGWMAPDFDLAHAYRRYLHPDAEVRMSEEHPMLHGAEATIAAMNAFVASGGRVVAAVIEEVFARGPLVVTIRTDVVTIPGQGDVTFKIAATFIVKDGRIVEWAEFFIH